MIEIYAFPLTLAPVLLGFRDGVPVLQFKGPDGEKPDSAECCDAIIDDITSLIFPHLDPEYLGIWVSAEHYLPQDEGIDYSQPGWIEVQFTQWNEALMQVEEKQGSVVVNPQFIIRWG